MGNFIEKNYIIGYRRYSTNFQLLQFMFRLNFKLNPYENPCLKCKHHHKYHDHHEYCCISYLKQNTRINIMQAF